MLGYGVGVGEYRYLGIFVGCGGGTGESPFDIGPSGAEPSNFKAGFLKDLSMCFFGTNNFGKSGGGGVTAGYLTGGYFILSST